MDARAAALDEALPRLRCPVCRQSLARDGGRVDCREGHAFDVARQGYLNLAVGARAGTADTAAMVGARAELLAAGHLAAVAEAVTTAASATGHDVSFAVDLAGGTGYYLAHVLDATGAYGACLDLSAAALRRAARAHPRAAAVGADAWRPLPLRDGVADLVLSVFGPRDPAEIERVLAPAGRLVVAAPTPDHLAELTAALGLLSVDPHKTERMAVALSRFDLERTWTVHTRVRMSRDDACLVAAMGPSAWHTSAGERASRADALDEWTDVTVSVSVSALAAHAA